MKLSRREFVLAGATTVALAACADDGDPASPAPSTAPDTAVPDPGVPDTTGREAPAPLTEADFAAVGTCGLLRAAGAGPFPLDEQFDRRDITEGYPGHPVRLGVRVIGPDCEALGGAAVEVWHTDATGDYSAFADGGGGKDEGAGTTFCRGTQVAGDDGIVEFATLYPGWYPGRTPHIHLRVRLDGATMLTSQVYFDDAYTAAVYREDPYAAFGEPDTTTAADGIAGDVVADGSLLSLSPAPTGRGPGTLALVNVGVA